jgi:hypothetical protein
VERGAAPLHARCARRQAVRPPCSPLPLVWVFDDCCCCCC